MANIRDWVRVNYAVAVSTAVLNEYGYFFAEQLNRYIRQGSFFETSVRCVAEYLHDR